MFQETIEKKTYKGLCSAVIYGPNVSGKTNIIGAMDTFKSIVLRGNIRNDEEKSNPNAAASALELIPNNTDEGNKPVDFLIKFITDSFVVEYFLSIGLGGFLEVDYPRKILSEKLVVNDSMVFMRNGGLEFGSLELIRDLLVNTFEQNAESAMALAKGNLNAEELFLINGFKTMFSSKLVSIISNWLDRKFMVIYRADAMHLIHKFGDPKKKSVYVEKTLNEAATYFGINSNALGYIVKGDNSEAKLCSIFKGTEKGAAIPADF